MDSTPIYLDYAAATPIDSSVLAVMQPYLNANFYNPSATYKVARQVYQELQSARLSVAHWLGAKPADIIFTAGGTEANNLAIHGIMRRYPEANLVVSSIEHESVLEPARRYTCRQIAVSADGLLDIEDLRLKIDKQTVLVSVMYANNEVGSIQPIRQVAALIKEVRRQRRQTEGLQALPLYLHTDACQAANYLDLHVARLGVDLLSLNGGKIYGPKQSGVLYVGRGLILQPLIDGGGQERNLRSGTENVASIIGLTAALDITQRRRHSETKRLHSLQQQFFQQLKIHLPQAVINGSLAKRLPNNMHITLPGVDNERLLIKLDERGVMAAAGSACSASNDLPSHVLLALGLDDKQAESSLRFSMGRSTTAEMITRTVQALTDCLAT